MPNPSAKPKRNAASRLDRPVTRTGFAPQRQSTVFAHMPAPVGGLNASDPLSGMSPKDCVTLSKMIPFQYGLRVRSGYYTWQDGSATMGEIRTLIAFNGSKDDGTADRLFACDSTGIWDVTEQNGTPTLVYTFPITGSVGGYGVYAAFSNAAGHFIAYCDKVNGYLIYREASDSWSRPVHAISPAWVQNTAYAVGDYVTNNGLTYVCTQAGTSENTAGEGPFGANTGIADGGVVWDFTFSVGNVDPATLRHVMVWKNRLWFCAKDSATAYYLPVNSVAGDLEPIYFGPRFRYGGSLVGLYSWTLDGGTGIDDLIVGISTSGDVVIYQGTDPTSASTFSLKGVWYIGAVPPGRRVASDFGGDLFVLSTNGCIPMSKIVAGGLVRDPDLYATQKIANLFNALMTEKRTYEGWELRIHPEDNTLIITVPVLPGQDREQLTMSLATKGWARHRGVPMNCTETWQGHLYFGTTDGKVCVNSGTLDDGTDAINFTLITSYQNMGSANKKRVQLVRPHFVTDGTAPAYLVGTRYDFNLAELNDTPSAVSFGTVTQGWDVSLWDQGLWDGGANANVSSATFGGGLGIGTSVSFVLKGTARGSATFVGFDVGVEQGGYL